MDSVRWVAGWATLQAKLEVTEVSFRKEQGLGIQDGGRPGQRVHRDGKKMKQIAQSYAPKQGGLLVAPRHGVLESWGCQREPWDQGLLGQHEVTLCISHPQQECSVGRPVTLHKVTGRDVGA